MEAFEQFCALALEAEGFVVGGPVKFPIRRRTKKTAYEEWQTHGYEVDLVGCRADRLVLASVKSYLDSIGVQAREVIGGHPRYRMVNDPEIRSEIVAQAAARYGFAGQQVSVRLYAGKFASSAQELRVREWAAGQAAGAGPITVVGLAEVVASVRSVSAATTYRDHPVIATMTALTRAGLLDPPGPTG